MKHETIAEVIERANSGDHNFMVIRKISDRVDTARVWIKKPEAENDPDVMGYSFYLIKNTLDEYVGAILDMGNVDLHLYTIAEHRQKGHMKSALKEAVLPHLKSQKRSIQNVTYKNSAIEPLLTYCGFSVAGGHASCDLSCFPTLPKSEENGSISEKEVKELVRACKIASAYLCHTKESIEGILSEQLKTKLQRLAMESSYVRTDIKDEWLNLEDQKFFTEKKIKNGGDNTDQVV